MRGLKMLQKKKAAAALLTMCMMAALAGCGASSKSDAVAMDTAAQEAVAEMEMMDYGSFENGSTAMGAMEESKVEAASQETSTDVVATDRKLIKTVDMNVETQEFDVLMSTIESQVTELGGYIENMNTYNGSTYNSYRGTRSADMTIRIPKNKLDGFLNTVSGISNVVRRSDNVEDVTLAYVDMESHRDALRTEQSRLLELLEKAETIEDIITIEKRLSDVRYQLESMESQLRTYDNQVDYSTVYLNIEEVEVFTPVEEETVGERIAKGFSDSLHSIGNGFVEFGIWFVVNIPYMVVCAVIVVVLIFVFYGIVKCFNKAGTKNKTQGTEQKENK